MVFRLLQSFGYFVFFGFQNSRRIEKMSESVLKCPTHRKNSGPVKKKAERPGAVYSSEYVCIYSVTAVSLWLFASELPEALASELQYGSCLYCTV